MPAPYEKHRAQLKAILLAWGMPEDNAEATADILSWADLHGVDSHGISMIPGYDRLRRAGRANMEALPRIIKEIRRTRESPRRLNTVNPPYDLPWLIHIEGDLHQPLHCVGRFVKSAGGKGDAGGNLVFIAPQTNLHSIWDGAAGRDSSDEFISKTAAEIVAMHPAPKHLLKDPKIWVDEGLLYCVREVYTFGIDNGTREKPITLPAGYEANAKRVAYERIALAGYRLAAILNEKLK